MATCAKIVGVYSEASGKSVANTRYRARLLRVAGMLSQKGQGRAAAHMTDVDAAYFLMGMLAPGPATGLVEAVRAYSQLPLVQPLPGHCGLDLGESSTLLPDLVWFLNLASDRVRLDLYPYRLLDIHFQMGDGFRLSVEIRVAYKEPAPKGVHVAVYGCHQREQFARAFSDPSKIPSYGTVGLSQVGNVFDILGNLVVNKEFSSADQVKLSMDIDRGLQPLYGVNANAA